MTVTVAAAADRSAGGRHRVADRGLRGRERPPESIVPAGGRPGERGLRNQGVAELIVARRRECCVAVGVQARRCGTHGDATSSVWFTVTLTVLVARQSARIGDRYLEVIGAGRGERGRGVLGRIGAVDREADRGRRRSRGRPGVGQRAFTRILIRSQDRRLVVVPVTGFGFAAAAVITVGA